MSQYSVTVTVLVVHLVSKGLILVNSCSHTQIPAHKVWVFIVSDPCNNLCSVHCRNEVCALYYPSSVLCFLKVLRLLYPKPQCFICPHLYLFVQPHLCETPDEFFVVHAHRSFLTIKMLPNTIYNQEKIKLSFQTCLTN